MHDFLHPFPIWKNRIVQRRVRPLFFICCNHCCRSRNPQISNRRKSSRKQQKAVTFVTALVGGVGGARTHDLSRVRRYTETHYFLCIYCIYSLHIIKFLQHFCNKSSKTPANRPGLSRVQIEHRYSF